MYTYTHTCTCKCIHIYIYICTYVYIYIKTFLFWRSSLSFFRFCWVSSKTFLAAFCPPSFRTIPPRTCVCVYVCVYESACVYAHFLAFCQPRFCTILLWMCVCVCVYVCVCAHVCLFSVGSTLSNRISVSSILSVFVLCVYASVCVLIRLFAAF